MFENGIFISNIMNEIIQQWLDADGAFPAGLALYRSLGDPEKLPYLKKLSKAALKKWMDPADKVLLRRLLKERIHSQPPQKRYISTPDTTTRRTDAIPATREEEEPAIIQELREKAIPLHKRYSHLKAQLYTHVEDRLKFSDVDRYEIAKEIMEDVLPPTDEIYDQIRAWEKDGTIPEEPQDDVVHQTVEKMQRVYNLRPRISRLKKFITDEDISADKREDYRKELLNKELELAELEQELGL